MSEIILYEKQNHIATITLNRPERHNALNWELYKAATVRQWVLTFPFPLRFLLAAQPGVLTEVLAIVQRGISTFLVRHSGFTVASGARTGAVTLIQRFGSALNLNMHLHMLFLDGAYRFAGGKASFYRARRSTRDELAKLLDALSRRIVRLLERLQPACGHGVRSASARQVGAAVPLHHAWADRHPAPVGR